MRIGTHEFRFLFRMTVVADLVRTILHHRVEIGPMRLVA
jgi:hypothetical protein